jgi:hypothetical protein
MTNARRSSRRRRATSTARSGDSRRRVRRSVPRVQLVETVGRCAASIAARSATGGTRRRACKTTRRATCRPSRRLTCARRSAITGEPCSTQRARPFTSSGRRTRIESVWRSGSASGSYPEGRRFESFHPTLGQQHGPYTHQQIFGPRVRVPLRCSHRVAQSVEQKTGKTHCGPCTRPNFAENNREPGAR